MAWGVVIALVLAMSAAPATASPADEVRLTGTLMAIRVDTLDDRTSGGSLVVDQTRIVVPSTVLVQMPGAQLTLQELFTLAPARCRATHESGLVPADACRHPPRDASGPAWTLEADETPRSYLDPTPTDEAPSTVARILATRGADGALVATAVMLTRTDRSVAGAVTFVNEEDGSLRINGALGVDEGGALLRLNDPEARLSVQRGAGCGAQGNCSPDVRFKLNTTTTPMSVRFEIGNPACVSGGLGAMCSPVGRPVRGPIDTTVMLPILIGDHITAQGGFEVYNGVRVFWAHALVVHTSPIEDQQGDGLE